MSGYAAFARFYDTLTANVDYPARATYFSELMRRHANREVVAALDLACGTASLLLELNGLGYEMIGVDASAEMLSMAAAKTAALENPPLLLRQPMERLDLYGTVDACVCALDSLNHLSGERALFSVFERVSLFLNPGGVFVFDLNTLYKHREVLRDNVFIYDTDAVFCAWRNEFDAATGAVDIELDFFEPDGRGHYIRSVERFREQYFSRGTVINALERAGLNLAAEYGGDCFVPPCPDDQRVVVVACKPKDPKRTVFEPR